MNKKTNFSISLNLGGDVIEGSGETALEALRSLPQPEKIFNKGIITLKHGESVRQLVWMPARVKRLWWKNAQPVLAKDFEKGLLGTKS